MALKRITEWKTFDGQKVPDSAVSPFDKKKEPIILQMLKKAKALEQAKKDFENYLITNSEKLYTEFCGNTGKEIKAMDSFTLKTYDQAVKVEARIQRRLELTDEIELALQLFNEYLEEVMKHQNSDIALLVQSAFRTNKGELDPKRLLSLQNINISHPKWKQANEVLAKSMRQTRSKRYFTVSERNQEGEYIRIY